MLRVEEAHSVTPILIRIAAALAALSVPVLLGAAALWLMLHPWYLWLAYHAPGFPADPYGFTTAERIHLGGVVLDHLRSEAGVDALSALAFPGGGAAPPESCTGGRDCAKLFSPAEVAHLSDVALALRSSLSAGVAAATVLAASLAVCLWRGLASSWLAALARGAGLTLALMALALIASVASFMLLFDAIHDLLFPPGTWIFPFSDTLIRLFPEQFWRDALLSFAAITCLLAVLAAGVARAAGMVLRPGP